MRSTTRILAVIVLALAVTSASAGGQQIRPPVSEPAQVVILGGIYGGVFTPTEASIVGVLYGLLVVLFV